MRPLTAREIKGNWATLLLPINDDDTIDYARLADEMDYLVDGKVDGIYSNGTAGEFYTQTEDEFDRIQAMLAERCEKGGIPFQIGASHMSAQTSLARLRRAVALKPSAIQIILPDWFAVTDAEALDFLARMAEAAHPIGLVLYNPPHAKRVLAPEAYATLTAAVPNLVGIKVAGGDEAWYAAMRQHAANLSVFVPGHFLATGMTRGAAGAYSNVACLHPLGAQRWTNLMQTDMAEALRIEKAIQEFMTTYILPFRAQQGIANQGLDKLLAAIGHWANVGTRLRWPYRWVPLAEADALRPVARKMVPELFAGG